MDFSNFTAMSSFHSNEKIDFEIEALLAQSVDAHEMERQNNRSKAPMLKIDTTAKTAILPKPTSFALSGVSDYTQSAKTSIPSAPSLLDFRTVPVDEFPVSAPILSSVPSFNYDYGVVCDSASILSPVVGANYIIDFPNFGMNNLDLYTPVVPSTPSTFDFSSSELKASQKRKRANIVTKTCGPQDWPTPEVEKKAYAAAASGCTELACEFAGCNRVFNRLQNLKSHWRCHSEEKPFGCEDCGFSFRRLPDLYRHRRSVHNDGKPHNCDSCGKQFARADALRRHIQFKNTKTGGCMSIPSEWMGSPLKSA